MSDNNMYRIRLSKTDRGICPKCGRREYHLYKDFQTNRLIDNECGRCSHSGEGHCNYHFPPRLFFDKYPERKKEFFGNDYSNLENRFSNRKNNFSNQWNNFSNNTYKTDLEELLKDFNDCTYIPMDHIRSTKQDTLWAGYLGDFLQRKGISSEDIIESCKDMGVRSNLSNQTLYFITDQTHNIRSAKILDYDTNGHRIHYSNERGKSKFYRPDVTWLHTKYEKDIQVVNQDFKYKFKNNVFGYENLLNKILSYGREKTIPWALESEKAAFIMNMLFKRKYPQIAMIGLGGKGNLSTKMLLGLKELEIPSLIYFPDKGCFNDSQEQAQKVFNDLGISIKVDDNLENSNLKDGSDIIDLIL